MFPILKCTYARETHMLLLLVSHWDMGNQKQQSKKCYSPLLHFLSGPFSLIHPGRLVIGRLPEKTYQRSAQVSKWLVKVARSTCWPVKLEGVSTAAPSSTAQSLSSSTSKMQVMAVWGTGAREAHILPGISPSQDLHNCTDSASLL